MSSSSALKRQKFLDVYPEIRDELLAHFAGENMPKDAQEWYKRVRCMLNLLHQKFTLPVEPRPQCAWRQVEPWNLRHRYRRDIARPAFKREGVQACSSFGVVC